MNVEPIDRQHKHTAKALRILFAYIESNFDDFTQSVDLECDIAIKLLARVGYHLQDREEFLQDILGHVRQMISDMEVGKI